MRFTLLLASTLIAACSSGPTEEESVQIWAASTVAMSNAQSRAVTIAKTEQPNAAELTLDFSGPCTLGGTVAVSGSYKADGSGDRAAFDLSTKFDGCREATGTLSGELAWTSKADANGFHATMTGGLDWEGSNGSGSCDYDLTLDVSATGVSYSGSLCGHDVTTEIVLGG